MRAINYVITRADAPLTRTRVKDRNANVRHDTILHRAIVLNLVNLDILSGSYRGFILERCRRRCYIYHDGFLLCTAR